MVEQFIKKIFWINNLSSSYFVCFTILAQHTREIVFSYCRRDFHDFNAYDIDEINNIKILVSIA